jgi:phage terminase small subunit
MVSMSGKPLTPLVNLLREIELGPAMQCLTEKQRNFVYAMIEGGGLNYTDAARAAGFEAGKEGSSQLRVIGHRMAHDTRIQEAMREMGPRMLNAGLFIAAKFVLETIDNPQVEIKDRLKASEMVMNRTGMHATSEQKINVTHKNETTEQVRKEIAQLSKQLGVDPKKLLGGNVVDAQFEEVPVDENSIEDLL